MGLFNLFSKSVDIKIDENYFVTVHNRKEAEFYGAGMLKILHDCANLVNTTKNPRVFFERYALLVEKLENLAKLEIFGCFKNGLPSKDLQRTLEKKEFTINDFIDRFYNETINKINTLKTDKAKDKRIENFYEELSKYNDRMLPANIEKYTNLYENLLNR